MYLRDNTPEAQEMRTNVLNLANSKDAQNIQLAMQLMQGGGFLSETVAPLWRFALEDTETKRKILTLFRQNLPADIFALIDLSFKYKGTLQTFAILYFDKLNEHEGITMDSLVAHILSYAFQESSFNKDFAKNYFYHHPKVSKLTMLKAMIEYETNLDFQGIKLDTLPDEIGELDSVSYLNFYDSNVKDLPDGFYKMKNLASIGYGNTPLEKAGYLPYKIKERNPQMWARLFYNTIYTNNNNIEESIQEFEEAFHHCPDMIEIFHSLISNLHGIKQFNKIIGYHKKYAHLTLSDDYYIKMIGDAYYEMGDYEATLQLYTQAVQTNPFDEYHRLISQVCLDLGKHKEAIKHAKEALQYDDTNVQNYTSLIDAHCANQDPKRALKVYQKALDNQIDSKMLLYKMIGIHKTLGNLDLQEQFTKKLLRETGHEEDDYLAKAYYFEEIGDMRAVIRWYKKALDVGYYKSQETRLRMSKTYMKMKKWVEAEGWLYENVQQTSEGLMAESWYELARLGALKQDKAYCLKHLKNAIALKTSLKDKARQDVDFDIYKQDEDFVALVQ